MMTLTRKETFWAAESFRARPGAGGSIHTPIRLLRLSSGLCLSFAAILATEDTGKVELLFRYRFSFRNLVGQPQLGGLFSSQLFTERLFEIDCVLPWRGMLEVSLVALACSRPDDREDVAIVTLWTSS